jgi:Iron only nitrogenase protein AnfO (AnfO_nitrog)
LAEKGIGVWQAEGLFLLDLLDHVKVQLERVIREGNKTDVTPIIIGEEIKSEYEIDLTSVLKTDSSQSSMKILIPFIQQTNFKKLTIICDHLPKWINRVLDVFKLEASTTEMDNGNIVAVLQPMEFETDVSYRKDIRIPWSGGCSGGGC